MPVNSGKVTFEQRPEVNKGSDCSVRFWINKWGVYHKNNNSTTKGI